MKFLLEWCILHVPAHCFSYIEWEYRRIEEKELELRNHSGRSYMCYSSQAPMRSKKNKKNKEHQKPNSMPTYIYIYSE